MDLIPCFFIVLIIAGAWSAGTFWFRGRALQLYIPCIDWLAVATALVLHFVHYYGFRNFFYGAALSSQVLAVLSTLIGAIVAFGHGSALSYGFVAPITCLNFIIIFIPAWLFSR